MMKKDWSSFKLSSHEDKKLISHLNEVRQNSVKILNNINEYSNLDDFEDLKTLIKVISISHDFGKSSNFFQNKLKGKKGDSKLERHGLISALFGLFLLEETSCSSLKRGFSEATVFRAIRRHHGNLKNFETDFKYEGSQESTYKEVFKIFNNIKGNKKEVNCIYNNLLESKDIDYISKFEEYLKELKNEKGPTGKIPINNTTIFKYKNKNPIYFYYFNLVYSILLESDKKSASETEDIYSDFNPSEYFVEKYKEQFDMEDEFNRVREDIYQETIENLKECLVNDENKFFEIDAPTGSGKTLTMLGCAFKIRNFLKENKNLEPKIIYSLPFISIIEQNYKVFKDVIENIEGGIGNDILLEHHHLADEIFKTTNEKEIEYNKSSFLIENWHSEIIVTTFFQLFKSIFTNKNHLLKKYNKLTNSIIMIDEIQSVPPGLISLIRDCIKVITKEFNSYVILATATKPKLNRKKEDEREKIISSKLFNQNDSQNLDEKSMNKYFNRYKISVDSLKNRLTINDLENILEEAKSLTNFMVVLNTISCTKKIYSRLQEKPIFEDYELVYLSTNISPKVRSERIERVKNYIERKKKFIVVTTQLIEAGVDISVERIYRDLAPLDKLIQTAGRTNRNNEKNFSNLVLFELIDEDNNDYPYCKYIYDDILLSKTRDIFNGVNEIDERTLINVKLPVYFSKIINSISQGIVKNGSGNEKNLFNEINELNHKTVDKYFRLIQDDLPEISFFIIDDEKSKELWYKFVNIYDLETNSIEDYNKRKKKFSIIKKQFNRQIVTIRVSSKDEKKDMLYKIKFHSNLNGCNSIIPIDKETEFYNETTGINVEKFDKAFII